MTKTSELPLSKNETTLLTQFLSSERAGEEPLDYIATHGFLTALAICPVKVDSDEWLSALFSASPGYRDDTEAHTIQNLLSTLLTSLQKRLESGELIKCPFTSGGDHEAELQNWCTGFVEAFFINEESWFSNREEEVVAELTLPVMALSGLFEEELDELIEDETRYESLIEQLPETLTDLYLFYHACPEK